jgi:hypothetical protein
MISSQFDATMKVVTTGLENNRPALPVAFQGMRVDPLGRRHGVAQNGLRLGIGVSQPTGLATESLQGR